jgi:hypothetical protein
MHSVKTRKTWQDWQAFLSRKLQRIFSKRWGGGVGKMVKQNLKKTPRPPVL